MVLVTGGAELSVAVGVFLGAEPGPGVLIRHGALQREGVLRVGRERLLSWFEERAAFGAVLESVVNIEDVGVVGLFDEFLEWLSVEMIHHTLLVVGDINDDLSLGVESGVVHEVIP